MARVQSANRALSVAVGLSIALHLALLAGTPTLGPDWRYEAPAPLVVTMSPAAPVEIVPVPAARPVKRAAERPNRAAGPPPLATAALLEAPSPDGVPAAAPQTESAGAGTESPAQPGVEAVPATAVADAPVTAAPLADAPPPSEYPLKAARLVYDVYYAAVNSGNEATRVGEMTYTWTLAGDRYEVAAVAEAAGLVSLFFDGKFVQRSSGQLGAGGLVPERYTLDRGRGDRPETAQFDWAGRKLALAWKTEARTIDLPAGTQDPLSLMFQMYFVQPVPAAASVHVVTSRKLARHVVRLAGDETIATPLGSVRSLRFRREEDGGTAIEVWLDRDRNLLPARIYAVDRRGNALDQVIREARLEGADGGGAGRP